MNNSKRVYGLTEKERTELDVFYDGPTEDEWNDMLNAFNAEDDIDAPPISPNETNPSSIFAGIAASRRAEEIRRYNIWFEGKETRWITWLRHHHERIYNWTQQAGNMEDI